MIETAWGRTPPPWTRTWGSRNSGNSRAHRHCSSRGRARSRRTRTDVSFSALGCYLTRRMATGARGLDRRNADRARPKPALPRSAPQTERLRPAVPPHAVIALVAAAAVDSGRPSTIPTPQRLPVVPSPLWSANTRVEAWRATTRRTLRVPSLPHWDRPHRPPSDPGTVVASGGRIGNAQGGD